MNPLIRKLRFLPIVPCILLVASALVAPQAAKAEPAYCTGKVVNVLVRTDGSIWVMHNTAGPYWVVVPGSANEATQDKMLTLLVTAYVSGRNCQLRLASGSCGSIPKLTEIEYVMLSP